MALTQVKDNKTNSSNQKKSQNKKWGVVLRGPTSSKAISNPESYFCIFCDELYPIQSQSLEDWIKCQGAQWSHESCSDFDRNNVLDYTCDFCRYGTKNDA